MLLAVAEQAALLWGQLEPQEHPAQRLTCVALAAAAGRIIRERIRLEAQEETADFPVVAVAAAARRWALLRQPQQAELVELVAVDA